MQRAILILLALCVAGGAAQGEEPDRFEVYRRLSSLGLELVLIHTFAIDTLVTAIDRLPEGKTIPLDIDEDGRTDLLAWREGSTRVVAVDEDGDMSATDPHADFDSDCYLADLNADGKPDRLVDYIDDDQDGDPDRQDLYEITRGPLGGSGVAVTIVVDLDDDNRLFHTTDYTYHTNRDQWMSDFDGNLFFLAALRDEATGRWTSRHENPFCFYDSDADGWSDEALRLEGRDLEIDAMRWSFDLDGDAPNRGDHDYDFSLSAVGPIHAPASLADSLRLRDGRVVRFVAWDHARDLARWGLWRTILLVWDEDDKNTATSGADSDRERWEGVIAEPFRGFPAIGGPACGMINKRYELDRNGSGRLGLYWSGVDDRLHLAGADVGLSWIVLSGDPTLHRQIEMADSNQNGYFDTWIWTGGGDPGRSRTIRLRDEAVRPVRLDSESLRRFWADALPDARDRAKRDFEQLARSIRRPEPAPVRRWWLAARDRNDPLAVRAEQSLEVERLLYDLSLLELGGGFLARNPESAQPAFILPIDLLLRPDCGNEFQISQIPQPARRAIGKQTIVEQVVGATRSAGQLDDLDLDGKVDRLYFAAIGAKGEEKARLEIAPPAPLPRSERVRVDPFFANGVAFESLPIAYRTYNGIVDLFVKRRETLILRGELGDYHSLQPWGIDALIVGDGPGIGGLYFEERDQWHPLFGSAAATEQTVIAAGPERTIVQVRIESGPVRVVRTFELDGGERVFVDELHIEGGKNLSFAVALTSLDRHGYLSEGDGIWSFGESAPGIGAIGLAGVPLLPDRVEVAEIENHPGLRFRSEGDATIGFAWVAGGIAYGDSTDAAWQATALRLLQEKRSARDGCH